MKIYRLEEASAGAGFGARNDCYVQSVESAFERFYEKETIPPDDLIHVTCTGYALPSNAQRLVHRKGWSRTTTVTHLYHMGCFAAIPAVRLASSFLAASRLTDGTLAGKKRRVDVVHTELCCLHLNPSMAAPKDIVAQSLFADGLVRYSAVTAPLAGQCGLKILTMLERIVPGSEEAMTWLPREWGMSMHLDRSIPDFIDQAMPDFLSELFSRAKLDFRRERADAVFAIHPGGPKILDLAERRLELKSDQVHHSRQVLRDHGNMSSATLPHIWDGVVHDPKIPAGALVISLAFGPGLTVCGNLSRKTNGAG